MYKLIRDNYVGVIDPKLLSTLESSDDESIRYYVVKKIHEELDELSDSEYQDVNEYADVIEILMKMANEKGISEAEIQEARRVKNEKRGKFNNNLIFNLTTNKET